MIGPVGATWEAWPRRLSQKIVKLEGLSGSSKAWTAENKKIGSSMVNALSAVTTHVQTTMTTAGAAARMFKPKMVLHAPADIPGRRGSPFFHRRPFIHRHDDLAQAQPELSRHLPLGVVRWHRERA